MPRRPRVFVEGMVYHVYNRVGRGEAPFKLEDEAQRLWGLLHDVRERDGLSVYAWCIMPNHYHLAVRAGTVPLWRSIRFVQHRYSQEFNRRCRVLGPVWQSRYKARPIEGPGSLDRVLAYIHLNPVTAGIVTDPASYGWSGHRELLGRSRRPLIDRDAVLSWYGGTRRDAVGAYVAMLHGEREEPWMGAQLASLPWWSAAPEPDEAPLDVDALGRSSGPERPRIAVGEFLHKLEPLLGFERSELAGGSRTPELVEARELLGTLAVERWRITVKAVAEALGKSRDGVSHWVRRGAAKRSQRGSFAARLEELDEKLVSAFEGTASAP